jgi:hypothetical protein
MTTIYEIDDAIHDYNMYNLSLDELEALANEHRADQAISQAATRVKAFKEFLNRPEPRATAPSIHHGLDQA